MPRHGNAPGPAPAGREEHDRAGLILHPRAAGKSLRRVYVEKIGTAWQKATSDAIDAGLALLEAKDELPHGEFLSMIETDLPFSARTAQRLMAIAGNQVLIDATHVSLLPPAWGSLYELTRLTEPELKEAIAAGAIHPKMERKDVAALLRPRSPASTAVIDVEAAIVDERPMRVTLGPPRDGMQFARMAVMDLEQIKADDVERKEALGTVAAWLQERGGINPSAAAAACLSKGERRLEWEHGVVVGAQAALSAIREHPEFETLTEKVLAYVMAELLGSDRKAAIEVDLRRYVDRGACVSPTDAHPAPAAIGSKSDTFTGPLENDPVFIAAQAAEPMVRGLLQVRSDADCLFETDCLIDQVDAELEDARADRAYRRLMGRALAGALGLTADEAPLFEVALYSRDPACRVAAGDLLAGALARIARPRAA